MTFAHTHRGPGSRAIALVVAALGLLLALPAQAKSQPVYNVSGSPIPAGLTARKIQAGIIIGGTERGWVITSESDGHLLGTLKLRKHVARVDIQHDDRKYDITYRDSENLDFENGTIHRNYNKWIRNLDADIGRALQLVALQSE